MRGQNRDPKLSRDLIARRVMQFRERIREGLARATAAARSAQSAASRLARANVGKVGVELGPDTTILPFSAMTRAQRPTARGVAECLPSISKIFARPSSQRISTIPKGPRPERRGRA